MPTLIEQSRRTALLACAAILLSGACRKPAESSPAIAVACDFTPRPPRVGPVAMSIRLANGAGKPLTGARLDLEGDMAHAGMSPVFGEAKEADPGLYRGTLTFTMAGDWVVLMHVILPSGQKVERQVEVKHVRSN